MIGLLEKGKLLNHEKSKIMPCRSDYQDPTQRELESIKVLNFLKELGKVKKVNSYGDVKNLDRDTAKLCKLCSKLSKSLQMEKQSLELQIWWRDHQAADLARMMEEEITEFNIFQPMLSDPNVLQFGRKGIYHILAIEGDSNYASKSTYYNGKKILFKSPKDRKLESDKMTNIKLLVFDSSSLSLDWKCTYRNTKGVYFKKHRDKFYIIKSK